MDLHLAPQLIHRVLTRDAMLAAKPPGDLRDTVP